MVYELGNEYQKKAEAFLQGSSNAFESVSKPSNALEAALKLVVSDEKPFSPEQFESLYNEFCYNRLFSEILLSNPQCPTKLKHKIVTDTARFNPNTPKVRIATTDDKRPLSDIRNELLDPQTSTAQIEALSKHMAPWVRASCVLHPNLSPQALHQLAIDPQTIVRKYSATQPSLTNDDALTLAKDTLEVQRALARNEWINPAVQAKLLSIDDEFIHIGLANHTEEPEIWQGLLEIANEKNISSLTKGQVDGLFYYLFLLLSNPKTKGLSKFMNINWGNELFLYRLLIRHPNITSDMVSQLSYYWAEEFKHNPAFAMKLLEDIDALRPKPMSDWKTKHQLNHGNPHYLVRYHLQHSPDNYSYMRSIAMTWRLPFVDQLRLASINDANTKKCLASRKDIDEVCLQWLALDKLASIRELVAKNPSTSECLLQTLANDKDAKVKTAAQHHKKFVPKNTATQTVSETLRNKSKKADQVGQ